MARLVYTVVGNKPNELATTEVHLYSGTGSAMSKLKGFGVAFATLLNNMIGGKIVDCALVFDVDISSLTGNSEAEVYSDVEEVAAFEFSTAQGDRIKVNIPSVFETAVIDETHELDQADTRVQNVISMFVDGGITISGGTVYPSDIGEVGLVGLLFAREQWRNSGARKKK